MCTVLLGFVARGGLDDLKGLPTLCSHLSRTADCVICPSNVCSVFTYSHFTARSCGCAVFCLVFAGQPCGGCFKGSQKEATFSVGSLL